jgi:succinate dehydrogenase hydrophobic anchor subunit
MIRMSKNSVVARRRRKSRERQERRAEKASPPRSLRERLITALIAIVLTVAFGLFIFEAIFPTTYEAPTTAQSTMTENFTLTMLALVVAGLIFYWIGWRVLVGFDFRETALKPGRAAAIWVCLGILTLLGIFVLAFIGLLQAVAPS